MRSYCSGAISSWHSTNHGGEKNLPWLRDLLLGLWYFIWGQRLQSFPQSVKSPLSFHIGLSLMQVYGNSRAFFFFYVDVQYMHLLAISAMCTPGLYLEKTLESQIWSCVEAAGLREKGSLVITTEGLFEAWWVLVLRDPAGGKAEEIEKKWKKRGKERKAHACPCVHTYTASFVWLLLPVGTCSKWKYLQRGTSQPPLPDNCLLAVWGSHLLPSKA